MKLTLIRHGQTHSNVQNIVEGHTHGALNEVGEKQAEQLGKRLQHEQFAVIYASDLLRAKQTAAAIIKHHPEAQVIYTPALRERHWGTFEGKAKEALLQKRKELLHVPFATFKPEEGESLEEVQARIKHFYERLLRQHLSRSVLVVAHAGIITCLLLHLLGKDATADEFAKLRPENTAVTVLEVSDDKQHAIKVLNCTAHLGA